MRVTAIETIHLAEYPNILWVEVHADEGLIGLGETFRGPKAVAAHVPEAIAPYLLGKDPLAVDAHSHHLLNPYVGYGSSGAEIRAASAMKIWPFEVFAEQSGGASISGEDLKKGLEPFRKIREAPGERMDIMCELHGLWIT